MLVILQVTVVDGPGGAEIGTMHRRSHASAPPRIGEHVLLALSSPPVKVLDVVYNEDGTRAVVLLDHKVDGYTKARVMVEAGGWTPTREEPERAENWPESKYPRPGDEVRYWLIDHEVVARVREMIGTQVYTELGGVDITRVKEIIRTEGHR